jgi:hypothetical protein
VLADNPKTWQEGYYYAEAIHIWQSKNLQEITSAILCDKEQPPTSYNQRNTWRDTPGSKPLEGHSESNNFLCDGLDITKQPHL